MCWSVCKWSTRAARRGRNAADIPAGDHRSSVTRAGLLKPPQGDPASTNGAVDSPSLSRRRAPRRAQRHEVGWAGPAAFGSIASPSSQEVETSLPASEAGRMRPRQSRALPPVRSGSDGSPARESRHAPHQRGGRSPPALPFQSSPTQPSRTRKRPANPTGLFFSLRD